MYLANPNLCEEFNDKAISTMGQTCLFVFSHLFDHNSRHEPGNGERIDQALHSIEEANGTKLKDAGKSVFQDISFNTDKLGEEKQKNTILRHLLEDFAKPDLNLKPIRIGTLDVIGNAYEYQIKNFAASGGQKAGEFYTPPEVSELLAELAELEQQMEGYLKELGYAAD